MPVINAFFGVPVTTAREVIVALFPGYAGRLGGILAPFSAAQQTTAFVANSPDALMRRTRISKETPLGSVSSGQADGGPPSTHEVGAVRSVAIMHLPEVSGPSRSL